MKKIVHYVPALVNGGIESMLINYCSKLKDEYEFIIISNGKIEDGCKKRFTDFGAKVYNIPYWKNAFFKHNFELFKILKSEKPDIFHTHFGIANFLVLFIAMISGVKIRISHCHTYIPKKSIKEKIFTFLSIIFATDFFACGEAAKKYLVGDKSKIDVKVLYNAVDLSKYKYNKMVRDNLRKKMNLNGYTVYGNVGRYNFQKNQLFLINIFEQIYINDSKSKFIIIGGNDIEYEKIVSKVNASIIKDNIILLKDISNVQDYYSAFDFLLLPSLYEGFAVTVVEAQASNLPCILSPTITHEFNSNCVYYSKSLTDIDEWLYTINSVKKINRNTNFIDLSNFDISTAYTKLNDIYKTLLKRRKNEK